MDHPEAEFILGATSSGAFPESEEPEFAFIGRSNVGKSSLLNNLVRRKKLAHISSTPGKTQQLNFFRVQDIGLFVDVPGFGYAKVSRSLREQWTKLIKSYLLHRRQLRAVCYLLDSRHDPGDIDLAYLEWLELNGLPYVVILTKTDKISPADVREREQQIRELLHLCRHCIDVVPHSSKTSIGRTQIWAIIKRERKAQTS